MISLDTWISEGRHLPSCLRDKDVQVKLFSDMHAMYEDPSEKGELWRLKVPSAAEGLNYVMQGFLVFMAQHGYVLRVTNAKRAKTSFVAWRKSGLHLPAYLRDFHRQKEVFKAMDGEFRERGVVFPYSWAERQCYVFDWFLWWVARYGLVLRRTNAKVPFRCLPETVDAFEKRVLELWVAAK